MPRHGTHRLPARACDARYIPADEFEDVAWRTLAAAVRDPAVLVSELRDHFATGGGDLGQEMASLRREILDLKGQQKRLLDLFQKEFIDEDLLAGQIGPLKALTEEKERSLRVLEDQQRYRDDVSEVEARIFEACREIAKKLDTLDFEGRRAAFAAFGVKVQATREDMSMTVVVDPRVTTIGQTLACSPNWSYTVVLRPRPGQWPANSQGSRHRSRKASE